MHRKQEVQQSFSSTRTYGENKIENGILSSGACYNMVKENVLYTLHLYVHQILGCKIKQINIRNKNNMFKTNIFKKNFRIAKKKFLDPEVPSELLVTKFKD